MQKRYYLDSCIWRDYFENRSDRFRPLGDWALALIKKIIAEGDFIVYSDVVEDELRQCMSEEQLAERLSIIPPELLICV